MIELVLQNAANILWLRWAGNQFNSLKRTVFVQILELIHVEFVSDAGSDDRKKDF